MSPSPDEPRSTAARFATTRWGLVLSAGRGDLPGSRHALEDLCRTYWRPIYAFLRRRGHDRHEAEDLTQGFFARFLERNYLEVVTPEKGKFRSYLLGALKHFLANERERARAAKRGGGRAVVPLEADGAERRYAIEPRDDLTPERIFDRCWALELLDRVLSRLEDEYAQRDRGELFSRLRASLTGGPDAASYKDVAGALGMTEGAVKVAVHRLRRRYRELLTEEVAGTVRDPGDVGDELRELLAAVSG